MEDVENFKLLTKLAAYSEVFGGVIIALFMMAAFYLQSGYTIQFVTTMYQGSAAAVYRCGFELSVLTSLVDLSYFDFFIGSEVFISNGDVDFFGPILGASILRQFGGVTFVFSLFVGLFAVITGLVTRRYPRIGGVMAITVVILLLFLGIPFQGLVPLLGTILIVIGGILGLTVGGL